MRIEVYDINPTPDPADILIGTRRTDGKTYNFEIAGITNAILSSLNISSINYIFSDESDENITNQTPGYFFTNGNTEEPDQVSVLTFNQSNRQSQNLTQLYNLISSNTTSFILKLASVSNPNKVSYFRIISVSDEGNYFEFSVSLYNSGSYSGTYDNAETYIVDFLLVDNQSLRVAPAGLPLTLKAKGYTGTTPNTGESLQIGDWCYGHGIQGQYIELARYEGGDPTSYASYTIVQAYDL